MIRIKDHKNIVTLTLNRSGKRNALSIKMIDAIHRGLDEIEKNTAMRVFVLAGEGQSFCSGMDLRGVLDDPEAMGSASKELSDVMFCKDAYEACHQADAVVLVTEWNEFRALDLVRLGAAMREPVLFDLRNVYERETVVAAGFVYYSVGRR